MNKAHEQAQITRQRNKEIRAAHSQKRGALGAREAVGVTPMSPSTLPLLWMAYRPRENGRKPPKGWPWATCKEAPLERV